MILVRLRPGGVLHVASQNLTITPGQTARLPRSVIERYADRLEVIERTEPPPVPPATVAGYHVGGGWYQVPGHTLRVRKAEAELILRENIEDQAS